MLESIIDQKNITVIRNPFVKEELITRKYSRNGQD